MQSRRRFIGTGIAASASAMTVPAPGSATTTDTAPRAAAGVPVALFIAELGQPAAIDAGRVAAGQGVPVTLIDGGDMAAIEQALADIRRRRAASVVGMTTAECFEQVRSLAAAYDFAAHSAEVSDGRLLCWIVGPDDN